MAVKVRPMAKRDKPAIMRILSSLPEFKPGEVVVAGEVIDSYLDAPGGPGYHILVAEADQAVAGYICYGPTPLTEGTWDIYWQAVAPDKQGQGIGATLMALAESNIRDAGGRLAIIETSSQPNYEKTRRFHIHQGYEMVCQIPDFYSPGDGKLILRKKLR